jgi:hypothetical protein
MNVPFKHIIHFITKHISMTLHRNVILIKILLSNLLQHIQTWDEVELCFDLD